MVPADVRLTVLNGLYSQDPAYVLTNVQLHLPNVMRVVKTVPNPRFLAALKQLTMDMARRGMRSASNFFTLLLLNRELRNPYTTAETTEMMELVAEQGRVDLMDVLIRVVDPALNGNGFDILQLQLSERVTASAKEFFRGKYGI